MLKTYKDPRGRKPNPKPKTIAKKILADHCPSSFKQIIIENSVEGWSDAMSDYIKNTLEGMSEALRYYLKNGFNGVVNPQVVFEMQERINKTASSIANVINANTMHAIKKRLNKKNDDSDQSAAEILRELENNGKWNG